MTQCFWWLVARSIVESTMKPCHSYYTNVLKYANTKDLDDVKITIYLHEDLPTKLYFGYQNPRYAWCQRNGVFFGSSSLNISGET